MDKLGMEGDSAELAGGLHLKTRGLATGRLKIKLLPEECLEMVSKDNQIQFVFNQQSQKYPLTILSQGYS